ncbi:MAG TPA: bacteriocin [Pseudomonas sp.]|nr:bacteriocin [Pseudomonas sp.]
MVEFVDNGNWMLPPGYEMHHGQYLQSPNGRYRLIFQEDSNFVMYEGQTVVWVADLNTPASSQYKIYGNKTNRVVIEDGRLSVWDYNRDRRWYTAPTPVTAEQYDKVYAVLQDDSNFVCVLFTPLFRSDPALAMVPDARGIVSFMAGARLEQGKSYRAGDKTLIFQSDGNLVVYNGAMQALWNTGTPGSGADIAVMQEDGNFVLYNSKTGAAVWNAGTVGHPGAYAMLTDNGCFSVVTQAPIWARFGYKPTAIPIGKPDPKRIILGPFQVINWAF